MIELSHIPLAATLAAHATYAIQNLYELATHQLNLSLIMMIATGFLKIFQNRTIFEGY